MGICALCSRNRARSTVFIRELAPDDNFKYIYHRHEGEWIMIHQKCLEKRKDLTERIITIGNIAWLFSSKEQAVKFVEGEEKNKETAKALKEELEKYMIND